MKSLPIALALVAALTLAPAVSLAQQPNNPDKPPVVDPVQPEPPKPTPPSPPSPPGPGPGPDVVDPEPPKPTPPPAPGPAGDTLTALDPQSVLDELIAQGFRGELKTTSTGRSVIRFVASGANSQIYFYDCKDGLAQCTTLRFGYGLDFKNGVDIAKVNEWNRQQLWGRVYVDDENDPWLDIILNTGDALPKARFDEVLDLWERVVGKFRTHFEG